MKKETYDKSVETGELQLVGFWPNLSHFGLVYFLLFMPAMVLFFHLIDYFRNIHNLFQEGELWILIVPPILAIIVYLIQKRRLKFRIIQTKLNHIQLKEILIKVAQQLEWEFISSENDLYLAKTNPSFFSGSWGEQITILFYQDKVFINSICDPSKRPSVVSWGRNRKNEDTMINEVMEEDHHLDATSHLSQ